MVMQHRFGDATYDAQVERWRVRVEKLRADGKDKPLVFPDWNKPGSDDRAVVYTKGAYAMHLLRVQLGEDAFWRDMLDGRFARFPDRVEMRFFRVL